jgi:hypothetical protein
MNAVAKRLFGGGGTEPPSVNDQLREEQRKAGELQSKIAQCEQETLLPERQERERLQALQRQLLDLKADTVLTGKPADSRQLEADIAASTARLAELAAKAEYVRVAQSKLTQQLREQQQRIASLQEALPRHHLATLNQRLTDAAGKYRSAIEAMNAALVEVAAIAAAYDHIGPRVAGFTGVASRGMASLDLPAPRHPAYQNIGGLQKLQQRVDVRKQEILKELAAS